MAIYGVQAENLEYLLSYSEYLPSIIIEHSKTYFQYIFVNQRERGKSVKYYEGTCYVFLNTFKNISATFSNLVMLLFGSFGSHAQEPIQSWIVCHVSSLASLLLSLSSSSVDSPVHRFDHRNFIFCTYMHICP